MGVQPHPNQTYCHCPIDDLSSTLAMFAILLSEMIHLRRKKLPPEIGKAVKFNVCSYISRDSGVIIDLLLSINGLRFFYVPCIPGVEMVQAALQPAVGAVLYQK